MIYWFVGIYFIWSIISVALIIYNLGNKNKKQFLLNVFVAPTWPLICFYILIFNLLIKFFELFLKKEEKNEKRL